MKRFIFLRQMKFKIKKNNQNTVFRVRRLGYAPYRNRQGKESFVRRIQGGAFPRFHLYISEGEETLLHCSIHIDQTAHVYTQGSAHRGDYSSPALESEVQRIEKTNLNS